MGRNQTTSDGTVYSIIVFIVVVEVLPRYECCDVSVSHLKRILVKQTSKMQRFLAVPGGALLFGIRF